MKYLSLAVAVITAPFWIAAAHAQTSAPADQPLFGASAVMDGADLAAVAGMADTSLLVRAQNTSTVSGNTVSGQSQTGAINFDSQSFSSLNGLSLLSANTGNNVSINSSLNVNVAILPR